MGVKCCNIVWSGGGGVLRRVLLERFKGIDDGDEGIIKRTLGDVRFRFSRGE